MADQRDVFHRLNAHHAGQLAILFETPELHALAHLVAQFLPRHVGFLPAVRWNYALIGLRGVVDDLPDLLEFIYLASPDHCTEAPFVSALWIVTAAVSTHLRRRRQEFVLRRSECLHRRVTSETRASESSRHAISTFPKFPHRENCRGVIDSS